MDETLLGEEMGKHPDEGHKLPGIRSPGSAGYTPMERVDKDRCKHHIYSHREERRNHSLLRVAGGTHQVVEADKKV